MHSPRKSPYAGPCDATWTARPKNNPIVPRSAPTDRFYDLLRVLEYEHTSTISIRPYLSVDTNGIQTGYVRIFVQNLCFSVSLAGHNHDTNSRKYVCIVIVFCKNTFVCNFDTPKTKSRVLKLQTNVFSTSIRSMFLTNSQPTFLFSFLVWEQFSLLSLESPAISSFVPHYFMDRTGQIRNKKWNIMATSSSTPLLQYLEVARLSLLTARFLIWSWPELEAMPTLPFDLSTMTIQHHPSWFCQEIVMALPPQLLRYLQMAPVVIACSLLHSWLKCKPMSKKLFDLSTTTISFFL